MTQNRNHIFSEIISAILNGDANEVVNHTREGIKNSMSAEEILEGAIIPAARQFAERFQGADFYIPEVLLASRAIKASLYALKPLLKSRSRLKKVVIGTVEGDIHDIGKNLIVIFLQFAGFEVIDLGVDVTAATFLEAVKKHRPDLLAMSALLTTTMGTMANVIELLNMYHLRDQVKVIVGGGPVTQEFAESIGADAYAESPHEVLDALKRLFNEKEAPQSS